MPFRDSPGFGRDKPELRLRLSWVSGRCLSPFWYFFGQSSENKAVMRLYIQSGSLILKAVTDAYIPRIYTGCIYFLTPTWVWARAGSKSGPGFRSDTTLGSVWAFFNYMGGVKDLRCKTRLVAWDKRANHRDHRGRERAQRIWWEVRVGLVGETNPGWWVISSATHIPPPAPAPAPIWKIGRYSEIRIVTTTMPIAIKIIGSH